MFLSSNVTVADVKRFTSEGYFKRLFDAVHEHPGAMRRWLLGVPMDAEFNPDGRAPDTRIKATIVEMSKSNFDSAVEELLDSGAEGVSRDILSSVHFSAALVARGVVAPRTSSFSTVIGNLGFESLGKVRWRDKQPRVWVSRELRATLPEEKTARNAALVAKLDQTGGGDSFLS